MEDEPFASTCNPACVSIKNVDQVRRWVLRVSGPADFSVKCFVCFSVRSCVPCYGMDGCEDRTVDGL